MPCPNCRFDISPEAQFCPFCQYVIAKPPPASGADENKPAGLFKGPEVPPADPNVPQGPPGLAVPEPSSPAPQSPPSAPLSPSPESESGPIAPPSGSEFSPGIPPPPPAPEGPPPASEAPPPVPEAPLPAPQQTPVIIDPGDPIPGAPAATPEEEKEIEATAKNIEKVYKKNMLGQLLFSGLGFLGLGFYVWNSGLLIDLGLVSRPPSPAPKPPAPAPAPPPGPAPAPVAAPPAPAPTSAPSEPVKAEPPGDKPADSAEHSPVVPAPALPEPKEDSWRVEGSVYDMISLKPVIGADVHFIMEGGDANEDDQDLYVATDDEGRYSIRLPPLDEVKSYRIMVDHADYADEVFDETDPPYRMLPLKARRLLASTKAKAKSLKGDFERPIVRDFILFPTRDLSVAEPKPRRKR